MVGLWVPRYESTRYGCSDVAGHWGLTHSKMPPPKAVRSFDLLRFKMIWDDFIYVLIDVVGKFIEMIFRSREISLKYFYIKISPLISSVPWWNPKVSKWDIWDLHLCQRAADLLSLTYTSASYSSATGWPNGGGWVVGWLGEGIPLFLGGGFKYCLFSPLFGEGFKFD